MSATYTDQIRPAAVIDSEPYVPVYARSGARKSNKPVKTWMILAPLGVLVVAGAAAAMLIQPSAPVVEEPAPFAPLAAQLAASEVAPLNAPSIPMETPAELTTAAPIPPSVVAPVARRAASTPAAPAQVRAARVAPRAAAAPEAVETPVPTGPQPYMSVEPQTATPTAVIQAAPVTPAAPPAPIVITPPN